MTAEQPLALDGIWAQVGASMEAFVRRRVRDPHQADDVVADIMLRIHRHLGTIDDHERVTAWVFRIARNAITDHYRRTGRGREVLAAEPEPAAARTPGWTTKRPRSPNWPRASDRSSTRFRPTTGAPSN